MILLLMQAVGCALSERKIALDESPRVLGWSASAVLALLPAVTAEKHALRWVSFVKRLFFKYIII